MANFSKSPWVVHYDGSSCNGCDIEVLACLMPRYDVERFGIINTGNPKHADVFLVTGSINEQNKEVVKQIYDQMIEPKIVVAVGICACSGGIFKECYNISGGVDTVIPVDVYVPGCAARPEAIIEGVVKGLAVLDKKSKKTKKNVSDVAKKTPEKTNATPKNENIKIVDNDSVSEVSEAKKDHTKNMYTESIKEPADQESVDKNNDTNEDSANKRDDLNNDSIEEKTDSKESTIESMPKETNESNDYTVTTDGDAEKEQSKEISIENSTTQNESINNESSFEKVENSAINEDKTDEPVLNESHDDAEDTKVDQVDTNNSTQPEVVNNKTDNKSDSNTDEDNDSVDDLVNEVLESLKVEPKVNTSNDGDINSDLNNSENKANMEDSLSFENKTGRTIVTDNTVISYSNREPETKNNDETESENKNSNMNDSQSDMTSEISKSTNDTAEESNSGDAKTSESNNDEVKVEEKKKEPEISKSTNDTAEESNSGDAKTSEETSNNDEVKVEEKKKEVEDIIESGGTIVNNNVKISFGHKQESDDNKENTNTSNENSSNSENSRSDSESKNNESN